MAKLTNYNLREYPEVKNIFDRLFGGSDKTMKLQTIKAELGENHYKIFKELLRIKQMTNSIQARLPFEFFVQ
jgi:protease-4